MSGAVIIVCSNNEQHEGLLISITNLKNMTEECN
jgi:hypothetical protein